MESTRENGRTILNNKSDFIISDNEKGRCLLNGTAFSGDRNVIKRGAEMILEHKDPTIEILRMWNVQTKVKPLIAGGTRTISNPECTV